MSFSAPSDGSRPRVAILGFGRFGRLLHRILGSDFDVVVHDPQPVLDFPAACAVSLEEAGRSDILFLCVPIATFELCLQQLRPHIRPDALVIDVLSVKEYAHERMQQLLPSTVRLLPSHPMFGPDSASKGLAGLPFVLCPVAQTQQEDLAFWQGYLRGKGLHTVVMSCEQHDRITARSLCLTQLLGRALDELNIEGSDIDTGGYKNLLTMRSMAVNDSWQLFEGLQTHNRYAAAMRDALRTALNAVECKLQRPE